MDECGTTWEDEGGCEHSCCLSRGSDIHDRGGHGCSCGERLEDHYWREWLEEV